MATKVQFSLRMIFVVTAVVAVFAAEAVAFPEWCADIVGFVVTLLLPPALVAGIIYAGGSGRAFSIGALTWWLVASWVTDAANRPFQIFDGGRIDYCIFWFLTLAGGGVAVLVRWFSLAKSSE